MLWHAASEIFNKPGTGKASETYGTMIRPSLKKYGGFEFTKSQMDDSMTWYVTEPA